MDSLFNSLGYHPSTSNSNRWIFLLFGLLLLGSIGLSISLEQPLFLAIPIALVFVFLTILDTSKTYYFLLACIPISIEYSFPNGFGTDLPTEPIAVGFLFVFLLKWAKNKDFLPKAFWWHPITLVLLAHLFWIFITTVNSSLFIVSFKYFLAKVWYIVGYFILAAFFIKNKQDYKRFFQVIFIPLTLVTLAVVFRHAQLDFSFSKINHAVAPLFRNHVNYACILVIFLPFLYFVPRIQKPKNSFQIWHWLAIAFFLLAIYLSYTRAAYVSVLLMIACYFIIKWKLIRHCIALASVIVVLGIVNLIQDNNYIDYAPNFERTITHEQFNNLISATAKGEDISTMERVYRWVAGYQMIQEKPFFGFGPGNFYHFYKGYTLTAFQTYVSDNPEKSGIHSYYLMTFVEQGFFGLLLFLLLSVIVLIKGEQIYHHSSDQDYKKMAMAALLSTIAILAILIINDMIEAVKVGSFFFINMALLVNIDLRNKKQLRK